MSSMEDNILTPNGMSNLVTVAAELEGKKELAKATLSFPSSYSMIPPRLDDHVPPTYNGMHTISIEDLRPYFNTPIMEVAEELNICITLMKKICRRNGIDRWPHRRIRSLMNRIDSVEIMIKERTSCVDSRLEINLVELQTELSELIENPNLKKKGEGSAPYPRKNTNKRKKDASSLEWEGLEMNGMDTSNLSYLDDMACTENTHYTPNEWRGQVTRAAELAMHALKETDTAMLMPLTLAHIPVVKKKKKGAKINQNKIFYV